MQPLVWCRRAVATMMLAIAGIVGVSNVSMAAGTAVVSPSGNAVEQISSRIIYKELEFAKLNTRLRLEMLPKNEWRGRRWFAYQLTNTSLTAVGAFITGCGRFAYLHRARLRRAPKDLFEHGSWYRVGANIDMTIGPVIEMVLDLLADRSDRRQSMDLPTLHKYAIGLQADLDGLIAQRTRLLSPGQDDAEGAVLQDLRDASVNEFTALYANARANRVMRNTQLLLTMAANATAGAGTYVGGIYASQQRRATNRWKTRLGGTGGICDVIASSTSAVSPILWRIAGAVDRSRTRVRVSKELGAAHQQALASLQADRKRWESTVADPSRKVAFAAQLDTLQELHAELLNERKNDMGKHFAEQMFVNGVAGASKFNNGIGGLVGSFHYTRHAHDRFEVFGGTNLGYAAGYSLVSLELIRNQLSSEIRDARARRANRAPRQILQARLSELESLQSQWPINRDIEEFPAKN